MRLNAEMRASRTSLHALLAAIGLTTAIAVVLPAPARAATPSSSYEADHAQAVAALSDIQAAISTIMRAEDAATTGPAAYKISASSAINALVGSQDDGFNAQAANPGDDDGAIGHVNQLLDRADTPPWVPDLHGVLANSQAAVSALQDANKADDLDSYQLSASQALTDLEVAEGRASEYGALGGMSGALANTDLAVTDGSTVENGCMAPQHAGFGLYQGYLSYRAVPLSSIGSAGIDNPGGAKIHLHNGMLVFYTAAAPQVVQMCAAAHAEAQQPRRKQQSPRPRPSFCFPGRFHQRQPIAAADRSRGRFRRVPGALHRSAGERRSASLYPGLRELPWREPARCGRPCPRWQGFPKNRRHRQIQRVDHPHDRDAEHAAQQSRFTVGHAICQCDGLSARRQLLSGRHKTFPHSGRAGFAGDHGAASHPERNA